MAVESVPVAAPLERPAGEPVILDGRPPRPRRRAGAHGAAGAGLSLVAVGLAVGAGQLTGRVVGPIDRPAGSLLAPASLAPLPIASVPPAGGGPSGPSRTDRWALAAPALLQADLDVLRAANGIPGLSATVIFPDGTTWTGVSGWADVEAKTAVTPDTAFALASISKTFTAALVLQLVEDGELRLSATLGELVPDLVAPGRIDGAITVAQLLDHTSGLADYFLNPKIDPALLAAPGDQWSLGRVLRQVPKPTFPPGTGWRYSNTNYLLLGVIAERTTGQTMAEAVRARLLEPLGLERTWTQLGEPARADLAHAYRVAGSGAATRTVDLSDGSGVAPFTSVVSAAGAAGSIAATSADVARWARLLYEGDVLGPRTSDLMLEGFAATAGYDPSVPYGFGVQAIAVDGHRSLGHSGRFLGSRGAMRHFPADGITIAVLTNQSRTDPGLIVRALLDRVIPPDVACPSCRTPR